MTIVEEPVNSLNSFDWGVYADWLEDQGLDSSRPRNIAKSLNAGIRKLFLEYKIGGVSWETSRANFSNPGNKCLHSEAPYRWTVSKEHEGCCPLEESCFQYRLDLLPLFWDKLAEIGSSL